MTSNEKIIMFMQGKNDIIKKYNKKLSYFKTGDKKEILSWSKKDANRIWKILKKNKNATGLSTINCPFCIYNKADCVDNRCNICGYGKRHHKCYDDNSTYDSIYTFISHLEMELIDTFTKEEINNYDSPSSLFFSKKFYNELIKRIEKEG
jgi:hypothetical protein